MVSSETLYYLYSIPALPDQFARRNSSNTNIAVVELLIKQIIHGSAAILFIYAATQECKSVKSTGEI